MEWKAKLKNRKVEDTDYGKVENEQLDRFSIYRNNKEIAFIDFIEGYFSYGEIKSEFDQLSNPKLIYYRKVTVSYPLSLIGESTTSKTILGYKINGVNFIWEIE